MRIDPGGTTHTSTSPLLAFLRPVRRQLQVAGALFAVVALGGVYVALGPTRTIVDRAVYSVIPDQWNQPFWHHVTNLGEPVTGAIGTVVAAAWVLRRDRRRAVTCIVAPILAVVLCEVVIKPLVGRKLGGTYCYPSGHVTTAAAMVGAFVYAAPRRWRALTGCVAALVAGLVAVAVIADRQHYPSDALASLLLVPAVMITVAGLNRPGLGAAISSTGRRAHR